MRRTITLMPPSIKAGKQETPTKTIPNIEKSYLFPRIASSDELPTAQFRDSAILGWNAANQSSIHSQPSNDPPFLASRMMKSGAAPTGFHLRPAETIRTTTTTRKTRSLKPELPFDPGTPAGFRRRLGGEPPATLRRGREGVDGHRGGAGGGRPPARRRRRRRRRRGRRGKGG